MRPNDMLRWVKAYLGIKFKGVGYSIDIIDGSCTVSCPSCAVGSIGRRPKAVMSIEFYRQLLDKAQREGKVRSVHLYAYSEPCTHPDLHLFVEEGRKRNIPHVVSTVLQHTRCDFAKVIEARPREFRISFPGWKHMNYYQEGARPEVFDKKFAYLMTLPRYPETVWTLGFHVYKDTIDEVPRARALAEKYGLKFVALPAIYMANDKNARKDYSQADKDLIARLPEKMEDEVEKYIHSDFCFCYKQITISATGMVWLCQLTYLDEFQIVPFMDVPVKTILKMIRNHPYCDECKAAKGNVYQEKYDYFFLPGDPVVKADKGRMR